MPCDKCRHAITRCEVCGEGYGACHKVLLEQAEARVKELEEFKEEDTMYFNQHELAWEEIHKHLKDTSGMDLPTAIKAIKEQAEADNKATIKQIVERLESIKGHIDAGNHHMAVAKILADISALKEKTP